MSRRPGASLTPALYLNTQLLNIQWLSLYMLRRKPTKSRSRQLDTLADTSAPLPLIRVPLALARHFIQICTAASADILAAEGMKSGQFSILAHLGREPGIDQNTLAARMGVDRARVSQLADELDTMGLI